MPKRRPEVLSELVNQSYAELFLKSESALPLTVASNFVGGKNIKESPFSRIHLLYLTKQLRKTSRKS